MFDQRTRYYYCQHRTRLMCCSCSEPRKIRNFRVRNKTVDTLWYEAVIESKSSKSSWEVSRAKDSQRIGNCHTFHPLGLTTTGYSFGKVGNPYLQTAGCPRTVLCTDCGGHHIWMSVSGQLINDTNIRRTNQYVWITLLQTTFGRVHITITSCLCIFILW